MADGELPLGFREEAWNDLDDDEKKRSQIVSEWDLAFLAGDRLIRHGISSTYIHESVLYELRRFLLIKILRDPHPLGCFGEMIAAAWQAFILDTQRYESFCYELYGKTIHHKPSNYGEGVKDNTLWISIYHEWFGKFPEIWKLNIDGKEIPGFEHGMNVEGNISSDDMDSDDGAF